MSSLSVRLPDSIHQEIRKLARQDNISINQFIVSAVTEKMAAFKTLDYLEKRAQKGSRENFLAALDKVPNMEPEDWDKLP